MKLMVSILKEKFKGRRAKTDRWSNFRQVEQVWRNDINLR